MSGQIKHPLVGVNVHSKPVDAKEAFSGVVDSAWLYKAPNKPAAIYFHVLDNRDGSVWHRGMRDLSSTPVANDNTQMEAKCA